MHVEGGRTRGLPHRGSWPSWISPCRRWAGSRRSDINRHPATRILALSGTDDLSLAEEALRSGADLLSPGRPARPEALAGPLRDDRRRPACHRSRSIRRASWRNTRWPPPALWNGSQRRISNCGRCRRRNGDQRHRRPDARLRAHRQTHGRRLLNKLGVTNRIAAATPGLAGLVSSRMQRGPDHAAEMEIACAGHMAAARTARSRSPPPAVSIEHNDLVGASSAHRTTPSGKQALPMPRRRGNPSKCARSAFRSC